METRYVLFEVRIEFLTIIYLRFSFKGLIVQIQLRNFIYNVPKALANSTYKRWD
jgi:hypothetical protein